MKNEIGYYTINNVPFSSNKIAATLEAQKTNAELGWYFFDDILNKVNWLDEPTLSLDQLYRIRAEQIRSQYDYVIVAVSGGADSTNVIRTFMNNNIHVDEVIAYIPESGLKNFDPDDKNFSATNVMSEIKYAQYPILDEVKNKSPNTKITIVDFFQDMISATPDAWIYESEGDILAMAGYYYGRMESVPHLKDLAESGKRIASVWGTDKPILHFTPNGEVVFAIPDTPVYLGKYPFDKPYPNVDRVLFYYTADLPEVMVKQAHVVAREIHKPENNYIYQAVLNRRKSNSDEIIASRDTVMKTILKMIDDGLSYSPKTVYQRGIIPFIYPSTYDPNLFQVRKYESNQTFLPAFGDWINKLHRNTRITDMLQSDFSLFYKNISPKYLNAKQTGLKPCVKHFFIGTQSYFKEQGI